MTDLVVNDVTVGYGHTSVVWNVSLDIPGGSVCALLGINGVGKTTLLKGLIGLLPLQTGDAALGGRSLRSQKVHNRARSGLGYLPQDELLFPELTVLENLRIAFRARTGFDAALARAIDQFDMLNGRFGQLAGTLSGGEQKMLILARAMLGDFSGYLVDEISEGVQPSLLPVMQSAIGAWADSGASVLMVEQNVDFALGFADHFAIMRQGRIVEYGPVRRLETEAKRLKESLMR